jgi:hypothetical protein
VIERFPSEDEATAYSVYQRLSEFVSEFEERTTASGALEAILDGDEFLGGYVNQKPEFFTEKQLIEPLLDALGYREVRWRPHNLIRDERNQPDFQILDPPPQILCIVESKRLGLKDDAKSQVERYLREDTFVKYATDHDCQYLVGIGTDGVDWSLSAKPLGVAEPVELATATIEGELLTLVHAHRRQTEPPERLVQDTRDALQDGLAGGLAKHNLRQTLYERFE